MTNKYELIILFEGYYMQTENGCMSNCSCTLLKSPNKRVIIDTRTCWDAKSLIKELKRYKIKPKDINYCISTHGHANHCGCNFLFTNAIHIMGTQCISKHDLFRDHDYQEPFIIDPALKIIATPGHTADSISVLLNVHHGIVAIVGDLIMNQDDLTDETIWRMRSANPQLQMQTRDKILAMADFIIPGHGRIFYNPFKNQIYAGEENTFEEEDPAVSVINDVDPNMYKT